MHFLAPTLPMTHSENVSTATTTTTSNQFVTQEDENAINEGAVELMVDKDDNYDDFSIIEENDVNIDNSIEEMGDLDGLDDDSSISVSED